MAKILFSTVSGLPNSEKLPCFYQGFVNALLREGNDVMLMVTNKFMKDVWKANDTNSIINKDYLNNSIINFNPDLVITFNNSLYEEIPKILDCPIVVWGVDSPAIFSDKENLKRNISRYTLVCATEDLYPSAQEYFKVKPKQLHTIYFATDFIAENLKQDINVSFIGTNFSHTGKLKHFFRDKLIPDNQVKSDFIRFINAYKKDVLKTPVAHLHNLNIAPDLIDTIPHTDFLNLISNNFRIQTLQNICDLGLHLYGSANWYEVLDFSLELALCFVNEEISSVRENQDVYNRSKIAINITHAQAKRGFGWRVRDIMATNACLVSDYREELVTQFGQHVKIPTYETPLQARELCQKLLKDDLWRQEIVAGSQLAIEQGHRFKHRFKELEDIFGLKLLNKSFNPVEEGVGQLVKLRAEDFLDKVFTLEQENDVLRKKIHILEQSPQYAHINLLYKACSKILPRFVKSRLKDWFIRG